MHTLAPLTLSICLNKKKQKKKQPQAIHLKELNQFNQLELHKLYKKQVGRFSINKRGLFFLTAAHAAVGTLDCLK